jgi:hypothetical protein
MPPQTAHDVLQTAYGLQFNGLPRVPELARAGPEDAHQPAVTVRVIPGDQPTPTLHDLDADRSIRRLADGRVLDLSRHDSTARFYGPPLDPGMLAHPYLGPVATTFNRWAGRESFHSGAFVVDNRAWAVLGPRTAGKSSLLAALAARQLPILSDDIVATDGQDTFAGPRCIDLREPLPAADIAMVRARNDSRWRVSLPPIPRRVAMGGWIYLHWGSELSMRPLPARELMHRLAAGRAGVGLASDPTVFLSLATLPAWDLERPRDWSQLGATLDRVISTVSRVTPCAALAATTVVGPTLAATTLAGPVGGAAW